MRVMRIAVALAMIVLLGGALSVSLEPPLLAQSQPVLQVSPTSLSFEGQAGGPQPEPQYLTIANAGSGIMEWHASADADWIILGAGGGKLSGGREIQLLVLVEIEGLEAGEYQGKITIEASGAQGSPAQVAVTLTLTAPPRLGVSPTSLAFVAEEGGSNPEPQTVTIKNSGGDLLSWEATTDADWLKLGAYSGSLTAGQSTEVLMLVEIASLRAGTHQARITVTAHEAQGSPTIVSVSLTLARYTVCSSGCPFTDLGQAIRAANPGKVITVGPGAYQGNWKISKSLTLRGVDQDDVSLRGVEKGKPVIRVEGDVNIVIEGFTITGAKLGSPQTYEEDGIWIGSVGQVTVRNSKISANGDNGIEVDELSWASVTIDNCEISSNGGQGIWIYDPRVVSVVDCSIESNAHAGIELHQSSNATIANNTISNTQAIDENWSGFGVVVWNSSVTISGNTIHDNPEDGGIMVWGDKSKAIITGNTIENNTAHGIVVGGSEVEINGNRITNTRSKGDFGGRGIGLQYNAIATMVNNHISGNSDIGISLSSSSAQINSNTIINNKNWGIFADESSTVTCSAPNTVSGHKHDTSDNIPPQCLQGQA